MAADEGSLISKVIYFAPRGSSCCFHCALTLHLLSPFNLPSCFHTSADAFFVQLEEHLYFSFAVLNLCTFAPGLGDPTGPFLNPKVVFIRLGDQSWSQNLLGRGTDPFAFLFG